MTTPDPRTITDLISRDANRLAAEAIPADHLHSFYALDLAARVNGLAVLAALANERAIAEQCQIWRTFLQENTP